MIFIVAEVAEEEVAVHALLFTLAQRDQIFPNKLKIRPDVERYDVVDLKLAGTTTDGALGKSLQVVFSDESPAAGSLEPTGKLALKFVFDVAQHGLFSLNPWLLIFSTNVVRLIPSSSAAKVRFWQVCSKAWVIKLFSNWRKNLVRF